MRKWFPLLLLLGGFPMPAYSDEGMWLFNDPPKKLLQEKYNFTLTDANGKVVKLSAYKGKVVLLNFWATWCGP